ncbi:hypothetical protein WN944_028811 [Citrus x changshan-huyou]|uniref:Malectin-like domain-containing protein n=1 Tax=Citrus x changshan-huyou TaxID=2935761 RepID=A0AAP0Q9D2_9ROSI
MSLVIIFLLWFFSSPFFALSQPTTSPQDFLLSCGDTVGLTTGRLKFLPDKDFQSLGNTTTLKQPGLLPILSTLRFFTELQARKYCYVFNVTQGDKYLVRTTYYYGGFDGGTQPPVFDQIIGGTKWSIVDTAEDFANGLSSYYEVVVAAIGNSLSVCLARNNNTTSHPFISAIELSKLDDSLYNTTDLNKFALSSIARSSFGDDARISFPDDLFNRKWNSFKDLNPVEENKNKVNPEDFWNKPPAKAFLSSITTTKGKPLQIQWPPGPLPNSRYYIALYFQENRAPSPESWRVFNVSVNGNTFFKDLNVTTNGVAVYGNEWPLSGQTNITMTPRNDMPVGPIISAGEIFQLLPLAGTTFPRDVVAMEELAKHFKNPPIDWNGDPCLPWENSWTGVTCNKSKHTRVVSIDLKGFEISGTLPESIGNLTALKHLRLGGNKLWGQIPEMKTLTALETLHLENNQFEGWIPQTLSQLPILREIFLQNNNLDGQIPDGLWKPGLNIQVSPGNRLTQPA